jgi:hypothetical protein
MDTYYSDFKVKTIRTLIRQSARWALAAQQDESPIIALLHANYVLKQNRALKCPNSVFNTTPIKHKILHSKIFCFMRCSRIFMGFKRYCQ